MSMGPSDFDATVFAATTIEEVSVPDVKIRLLRTEAGGDLQRCALSRALDIAHHVPNPVTLNPFPQRFRGSSSL